MYFAAKTQRINQLNEILQQRLLASPNTFLELMVSRSNEFHPDCSALCALLFRNIKNYEPLKSFPAISMLRSAEPSLLGDAPTGIPAGTDPFNQTLCSKL